MNLKQNELARHVRQAVLAIASVSMATMAFGDVAAQETDEEELAVLDSVEVTGSRLKRAEIEGALPVSVISRAQIDLSGDVSVAEVLRDTTFASFGNFSPRSGNAAGAVANVDLRGLGSGRTLVLIDGRRAPTTPANAASGSDLNVIPLAAVDRIEILSDGASAVYGSDAMGGVVNIILRKDFDGVELRHGVGSTEVTGGDTSETSVVFGSSSDRTSIIGGASSNKRGMVFTRDQIGGDARGVSTFGNNYLDSDGAWRALPGFDCTQGDFYMTPAGVCSYDFQRVAANDAKVDTTSVFLRGNHFINDDWSLYATTSITKSETFGRYAPTPAQFTFEDGHALDVVPGDGQATTIRHRFAAAGTRDAHTDGSNSEFLVGVEGRLTERVSFDLGLRRTDYRYFDLGKNYIVSSIARQMIDEGLYDLRDPFAASPDVLKAITATISRDSRTVADEVYGLMNIDLFEMGGGSSNAVLGAEYRSEEYQDLYDPLSESGQIEGSAGNSSAGSQDQNSAYFEWLLPFSRSFDVSLAGRYDKYSNYDGEFSPKVALRWSPMDNLTLRASAGEGFRVPPLDIITQQPSFSAQSVQDPQTCVAFGLDPSCSVQIESYILANPDLTPENSTQFGLGAVWSPLNWLDVSLDYYRIEIDNTIVQFNAQNVVNSDLDPDTFGPIPDGLGVIRNPISGAIIEVRSGFANAGALDTDGFDVRINMRHDFGDMGEISSELSASHINKYEITSPAGIRTEQIGLAGFPERRAALRNLWSVRDFGFGWNVNYIGPNGVLGSYTTNDVQISWNAPWNGSVSMGATNVGDRYPDLVAFGGRPWNMNLYNAYGRTVYLRYTQRF